MANYTTAGQNEPTKWIVISLEGTIEEDSYAFNGCLPSPCLTSPLPSKRRFCQSLAIHDNEVFSHLPFQAWTQETDQFFHDASISHEVHLLPRQGIVPLLTQWKKKHLHLALITEKGSIECAMMLSRFGMDHLFDHIFYNVRSATKKQNTLTQFTDTEAIDSQDIYYIGPSLSDICICQKVGIPIVSTAFSKQDGWEELITDNAAHLVLSVAELKRVLEAWTSADNTTDKA